MRPGCNACVAAALIPMVETTHPPIRFRRDFLWRFGTAICCSRRTPRLESAAWRQVIQTAQTARNCGQTFPMSEVPMFQSCGDQLEQTSRIGMKRPAVHLRHRACLDNAAGVHHQDSISKASQQSWIMRNEHQRRPILSIDVAQCILDLCLQGDVERTSGFVGNDKRRPTDQRLRDGNSMQFSPAELMRIRAVNAIHIRDPRIFERGQDFLLALLAYPAAVRPDDLTDLIASAHHGAQRASGLLKDHRDRCAASRRPARFRDL